MKSAWLRFGLWTLFVIAFGFFALGGFAYELVIGLDWTAYPFGEQIHALFVWLGIAGRNAAAGLFYIVGGALLVAVICGVAAWRSKAVAGADLGRRSLLAGAAGMGALVLSIGTAMLRSALGTGRAPAGWADVNRTIQAPVQLTHPEYPEDWHGARIRGLRRLGRTEWPVSDISVGSGRIGRLATEKKGIDIVRMALDRGVNYIDTSPDYSATGSESAVAEAIAGRRDSVFIATKFCTPHGHLGAGSPVSQYKEMVENSLRRLRSDYVDLVHIHACDSVERLLDPNAHQAFDELKQEGKVRFLGFSTHTPNLVQVTKSAIASGRFDVMMLAYHHGMWQELPELIERGVKEQDMGVVAMKTLKGAKHENLENFQQHAASYSQAALRWVLSNPLVSSAVISFFEYQHVDEYLGASGGAADADDLSLLEEYDRQIVGDYCSPHCGACLSTCPEGLAIPDVLRHRMYFKDYGDEKEAMRLYAQLEKNASVCAGCAAPCLGSCPVGIPIQEQMTSTHELLRVV